MSDIMLASNSNAILERVGQELKEHHFRYTSVTSGEALRSQVSKVSEARVALVDLDLPGWSNELLVSMKAGARSQPATAFLLLWDDKEDVERISGHLWENCLLMQKPRKELKKAFSGWTRHLADRVLALASLEHGWKVMSVAPDEQHHALFVEFLNGRTYTFPLRFVRGLDKSAIDNVKIIDNGVAFKIYQASGNTVEVPWDYVLYHMEPEYEHYKGRSEQRQRERTSRDRVARRLRTLRAAKGLTTYQLAERTGLHRSNITSIETGKRRPGLETLEKLARGLGVTVGQLLRDD